MAKKSAKGKAKAAGKGGVKKAAKSAKQTTKSAKNVGKPWTPQDLELLRQLANENTPTRVIGLKLGRSEASIRSKAKSEGLSLKPTNQSPFG